jgi:hypothetical protein
VSTQNKRHLIVITFLLLLYAFVRLHHLSSLPFFMDETIMLETSQHAWQGEVFYSAPHGRLLLVWYDAVLGPYPPGSGWTARAGIVLAGMAGLAAFYRLGRSLVSHQAGLIASLLWIFVPYLVFYERMSLADPLMNAISAVTVWVAWIAAHTGKRGYAVVLGAALTGVILAKASGIVWLPLPLVALLVVSNAPWPRRIQSGVLAYGTFAFLFGGLMAALRLKNYDYFSVARGATSGTDANLLDRIYDNFSSVWHIDLAYLSAVLVVLAILGGFYWLSQKPRPALYALLVLGMAAGGPISFAYGLNSRYSLNQAVWVLFPAAMSLGLLIQCWPRLKSGIYAAVLVGIAVLYLPFLWDAWNQPEELNLYGNDQNEYIRKSGSGFAVTEIGETLRGTHEILPTLGLVENCETLRLVAHPYKVTCPVLNWNGSSQEPLMAQVEAWAADGPVYVVGEALAFLDISQLPQPYTVVQTVERPGGKSSVSLYRVEQGAAR